ncbi:hypothetical protein HUT18_06890 [Streptomyces sp. NA04227]|uniref:hypothetical protein n=1 Tax=Streptomyces sp. NA04227 TaxID=2742136 RepID=UPI0015929B82|nr:hypothetical protein [Streptomyces sp. NA04227]QKW06168.1 hypothetical protein HUT18_06890 [Streptomyces sp. NA04227]
MRREYDCVHSGSWCGKLKVKKRIVQASGASLAALLVSIGLAGTAIAAPGSEADPIDSTPSDGTGVHTAPPEEPTEELVDVTDPASEPDTGPTPEAGNSNLPPKEDCGRPSRIYTPDKKGRSYHKGVGATLSNTNRTSRTLKSTFTSEVSGEVGVSVSAGLTTKVDFMIAEIEAKWDVELSAKITAKMGVNVMVDTPPKKTTNAKYGVYRLKVTGTSYQHYGFCRYSPKKTVTSYTPYKVGWYVWEE